MTKKQLKDLFFMLLLLLLLELKNTAHGLTNGTTVNKEILDCLSR